MYGYGIAFALAGTGRVLCAEKESNNARGSAVLRHYPDQDINAILPSGKYPAWCMGTAQHDPSPAHGRRRREMMMQMRTMVLEGALPHPLLAPLLLPFSLVCLLVLISSVFQNASLLIVGQGILHYETPSTQMPFFGYQTYCLLNSLIGMTMIGCNDNVDVLGGLAIPNPGHRRRTPGRMSDVLTCISASFWPLKPRYCAMCALFIMHTTVSHEVSFQADRDI